MQNNLTVFGRQAFRKHRSRNQARSIVNASLFDVMSTHLAQYSEVIVANNAELLRKKFYDLMDDDDFIRAITYGTNSTKAVYLRFYIANKMFQEVFDAA